MRYYPTIILVILLGAVILGRQLPKKNIQTSPSPSPSVSQSAIPSLGTLPTTTSNQTGWATFTDRLGGFSFEHPANFRINIQNNVNHIENPGDSNDRITLINYREMSATDLFAALDLKNGSGQDIKTLPSFAQVSLGGRTAYRFNGGTTSCPSELYALSSQAYDRIYVLSFDYCTGGSQVAFNSRAQVLASFKYSP